MKKTNFRWVLGVLGFLIMLVAYMDRVNLSVATPIIMSEFNFSKMEIGMLQTCFFVSYAAMQIPGGIMSDFFKHRVVVTGAVTWWSIFTGLTAYCSSFTGFAVVRALFGLGEAPVLPALTAFVGRWFPGKEKGRASSMLLAGCYIGPAFGLGMTVAIMAALGWREVFILYGIGGIFFAAAWYLLAKVSPKESSFVNQAELDYIEEGRGEDAKGEIAPWSNFFKSSQFWAIGILVLVADYVMYVYLVWLPLYLMEAQGFSLTEMGISASLPWIALTVCTLATGWIGDHLVAAGYSKKQARSYLGVSGFAGCGIFLYLGAMATNPSLNVLWLTLSLGSLGFSFASAWGAAFDIGGKYVGSVTGWINFGGNMGGVFAPVITAWLVTSFGWQTAILVTSSFTLIGAIACLMVKPDIPLKLQKNEEAELTKSA